MLRNYVTHRLSDVEEETWAESAIVTIVWLITNDAAEPPSITAQEFYLILQDISSEWKQTIRPEASSGALVVRPSLIAIHTRANRAAVMEKDRRHLQRRQKRYHGGLVSCILT